MSIQNISGGGASTAGTNAQNTTSTSDPVQDFLKYMQETPQQRMEDAWLHAHGLTREQLAAMSPRERQKILNQMKQDIEWQVKQSAEDKFYKTIGVPSE